MSDDKITQFPATAGTMPLDPWDAVHDQAEVDRITEALLEPFPQSAIQRNKHTGLLYVEYQQIVRRLIKATNNHFSTEVISLTQREWTPSKRSKIEQVLVEAVVRLTIPALGSSRSASGYQVGSVGAGEDLRKGAVSDAIKKAAQQYGVAIDLAGMDGEDMHAADFEPAGGPPPQQSLRQQNQQRPQGQSQRPEPRPPARLSEKRAQQQQQNQPQQQPQRSPRDQALHEVADYCGGIGITKEGMAAMVMAEYGKEAKELTKDEAEELNDMVRKPSPDDLIAHAQECLQHVG